MLLYGLYKSCKIRRNFVFYAIRKLVEIQNFSKYAVFEFCKIPTKRNYVQFDSENGRKRCYMPAKIRKRDMWRNIPLKRRLEIIDGAKQMQDGIRKEIVLLAFQAGLSTAEIAELAKSRIDLYSRNNRPISKRRVLQIIAEEVPDYNAYQIHNRLNPNRKDHSRFAYHHKKERCANCGRAERLEWHHMIPAFLGGTAEPENMICLCASCHDAVTAYQARIYPESFKAQKEK